MPTRSATAPTRADPPQRRARVVLLAQQLLVGESVRVALTSRGLDTRTLPWSWRRPDAPARRRIAALGPHAGLVFPELEPGVRPDETAPLVSRVPIPWLLLVTEPRAPEWGAMLAVGVVGVLPTSISLDDLATTLGHVMSGGDLISVEERAERVDAWQQRELEAGRANRLLSRLTPRERSVLIQLYEGRSVRQIADEADVSEGTVRSQVKSVLRKLDVNSQLAAVATIRRAEEWTPRAALHGRPRGVAPGQ